MTQRTWTDEQLSSFLDGELPAQEMDALSGDLEGDAALAARLERLASANAAYVGAIGDIDGMPMTAGLKAAMDAPPAANVTAFRPRRIVEFVTEHRAIAASLLCAAAVWGLTSTMTTGAPSDPLATGPDGVIVASSPLYRVLETARTGEAVAVGTGAMAAPRLTFASAGGGFCRQFDVVKGDQASAAIACRDDEGWRTLVVAYGLTKAPGDFQTASAARSPALEAFLDQRMSGAAMNADEEARLLRDQWKPTGR